MTLLDALIASDHGRLLAAGKFRKGVQRHFDRPAAAAGERHGEEIHQRALRLMRDLRRDVLPPRRDDDACKMVRNA